MITKQTQGILKSLLPINKSFVVSYPKMTITDEYRSLPGLIDLSHFEEEFKEFGIYDGGNFLDALGLIEDAEITIKDNIMHIKGPNETSEFCVSDPSVLEDSVANEKVITSTEAIASILEFEFNEGIIKKIKKASGVFKTLDALYLVKENGKVFLKIGSKNNFKSSENSYSVGIEPTLDEAGDLELAIPLENILKLPETDYTMMVKYNTERDAYRIVMKNEVYTFILSLMK